jgi:hypothetical protein
MAAVFYKPNATGTPIFRDSVPVLSVFECVALRELTGVYGDVVITGVQNRHNETIQYFLTFDDFISFFYYGKGLGELSVTGLAFMDCDGRMPGLQRLHQVFGSLRGRTFPVSLGWLGLTCVLNGYSVDIIADDMLAAFTLNISVIDNTFPRNVVNPVC